MSAAAKESKRFEFRKVRGQPVLNTRRPQGYPYNGPPGGVSTKPCHFYVAGFCRYGERCRYFHDVARADGDLNVNPSATTTALSPSSLPVAESVLLLVEVEQQGPSNINAGGELSSDETATTSVEDSTTVPTTTTTTSSTTSSTTTSSPPPPSSSLPRIITARPVPKPNQIRLTAVQICSDEQQKCRDTELGLVKRRFPDCQCNSADSTTDTNAISIVKLHFAPTDPDWPFDVKSIPLIVEVPSGYPIERFSASVDPECDTLPCVLLNYLTKSIATWIQQTHAQMVASDAFEPIFRSFLRWLDRSAVELFVQGLKRTKMVMDAHRAGISVSVPDSSTNSAVNTATDDGDGDGDKNSSAGGDVGETAEEVKEDSEPTAKDDIDPCSSLVDDMSNNVKIDDSKRPGATEIRLISFHLGENLASITADKLTLLVQCGRCPAKWEIRLVHGLVSKPVVSNCSHCALRCSVEYLPRIVHMNNAIIGELLVDGCIPLDLVIMTSEFTLTCFNCDKRAAAKSLAYGVPYKTWCLGCHAAIELQVNTVRFHGGNIEGLHLTAGAAGKSSAAKSKQQQQGVQIVEGQPLPRKGTCKHYSKSFRWFRFPCCGKVYPCDVCHEESESHEMKFANRIVCGLCSKEQPYQSGKACISCKGSVVKAKTTHWEGGKGCRDPTKMSKGENRKYAGSRQKTVSKQKQSTLADKTKKKDKD